MYFAGDDTWTKMFPRFFNKSEPRDSFNVNDLDTVDYTVKKFFKEEINNPKWDIMIGIKNSKFRTCFGTRSCWSHL